MSRKLLGMYIHMHWGYNHPYAARTWQLRDWEAYLTGLRELGYNFVQIWPMIDIMPQKLTYSDHAHLEKLGQVIRLAKNLEMTVFVGASANTLGNSNAENYEFAARPYFVAERRINPADPAEVRELMAARKIFLEPLAEADGFWIIDSDPGGFENSPVSEFVDLFAHHRKLLDQLRPGIELVYWMWQGWRGTVDLTEEWGERPEACWEDALRGLKELNPEPWGILARDPGHFASVAALGLTDRTIYFPYTGIEGEPNYPMTNFDLQRIQHWMTKIPAEKYPRGVLGNAQSHCLQLPHTYFFKHFAQGGTPESLNLAGFAEAILPGNGERLAQAWEALASDDLTVLKTAIKSLNGLLNQEAFAAGRLSGLYFNQLTRLVEDLRLQIAVQIAILNLRDRLPHATEIPKAMNELIQAIQNWAARNGFKDRYYGGPFKDMLHPLLKKIAQEITHGDIILRALQDFETGDRHDAFDRLFNSLRQI
jgi:hypothetical protein